MEIWLLLGAAFVDLSVSFLLLGRRTDLAAGFVTTYPVNFALWLTLTAQHHLCCGEAPRSPPFPVRRFPLLINKRVFYLLFVPAGAERRVSCAAVCVQYQTQLA